MAYECRVIADSYYEFKGIIYRITTMLVKLPRIVLAELNTHGQFARNSASSRAIPTRKQLRALAIDTFMPSSFGTAVGGMNAGPALEGEQLAAAQEVWGSAANAMMWHALCLTTSPEYVESEWEVWKAERNDVFGDFMMDVVERIDNPKHPIHNEAMLWTTKGLTNRLLEPFMWHEVIITATEWENFFNLRTDENAQEEIRTAAVMMKKAYDESKPEFLGEGEWHLPFIQPEEKEWAKQNPALATKASTARCARVSYLTHDTGTVNREKDYAMSDTLRNNGHMSPFEHAATPFTQEEWEVRSDGMDALSNSLSAGHMDPQLLKRTIESLQFSAKMRGWNSARRFIPGEDVFRPDVTSA